MRLRYAIVASVQVRALLMASFDLPVLDDLRESDLAFLRKNGFTVVEQLLSPERIEALRESFPKLSSGKFDTGVYPDEWYWREGMSLQDVMRHMANAWKAYLTIARLSAFRQYRPCHCPADAVA